MCARAVPTDILDVVEAAYRVDGDDASWLRGILDATRALTHDGLGMAAYMYDTAERPFRIHNFVHDTPIDAAGMEMLQQSAHDDYVRESWLAPSAALASETPGYADHPGVHEVFHPAGIKDVFVLNVRDPIGVGCWIGTPLREVRTLSHIERERWARVAAHIRAALRLRLRLARAPKDTGAPTEAVIDAQGSLLHVEQSAETARNALRDAVSAMQRARGALRDEPDRALPSWRALVQARWTLLDEFQSDGARYIVARANSVASLGFQVLAPREAQAVACASMGLTNKEIAYELGLSHSTVRVLISRASGKLGAKTRDELIAACRANALNG